MKTTVESIVEQFRQNSEQFEAEVKGLPELISLLDNMHDAEQSDFTIWDVKGFVALLLFALENKNGKV